MAPTSLRNAVVRRSELVSGEEWRSEETHPHDLRPRVVLLRSFREAMCRGQDLKGRLRMLQKQRLPPGYLLRGYVGFSFVVALSFMNVVPGKFGSHGVLFLVASETFLSRAGHVVCRFF